MDNKTTIEQEFKELKEKHSLTKEYLRRAMRKLLKSTEYFDIEVDGSDEQENDILKFVADIKRKRIV